MFSTKFFIQKIPLDYPEVIDSFESKTKMK